VVRPAQIFIVVHANFEVGLLGCCLSRTVDDERRLGVAITSNVLI
jgi:hypothetical protein